jgi:hypothetical protein
VGSSTAGHQCLGLFNRFLSLAWNKNLEAHHSIEQQ